MLIENAQKMVYMHINEITVRILIGNRSGIHQRNVLMGRLQLRCIFFHDFISVTYAGLHLQDYSM